LAKGNTADFEKKMQETLPKKESSNYLETLLRHRKIS